MSVLVVRPSGNESAGRCDECIVAAGARGGSLGEVTDVRRLVLPGRRDLDQHELAIRPAREERRAVRVDRSPRRGGWHERHGSADLMAEATSHSVAEIEVARRIKRRRESGARSVVDWRGPEDDQTRAVGPWPYRHAPREGGERRQAEAELHDHRAAGPERRVEGAVVV